MDSDLKYIIAGSNNVGPEIEIEIEIEDVSSIYK